MIVRRAIFLQYGRRGIVQRWAAMMPSKFQVVVAKSGIVFVDKIYF